MKLNLRVLGRKLRKTAGGILPSLAALLVVSSLHAQSPGECGPYQYEECHQGVWIQAVDTEMTEPGSDGVVTDTATFIVHRGGFIEGTGETCLPPLTVALRQVRVPGYDWAVGGGCGVPTASGPSDCFAVDNSSPPGIDWKGCWESVHFPAGVTQVTVTVTPVFDFFCEPEERVHLELVRPSNGRPYCTYSPDSVGLIVYNTPVAGVGGFASDREATEAGDTGEFRVGRSCADAAIYPLDVIVYLGGTAQFGVDYGHNGTVLSPQLGYARAKITIPAGQQTAALIITPINDSITEATETVTMSQCPTTPAFPLVYIFDNDEPGSLRLEQGSFAAGAAFEFFITGNATGYVTVEGSKDLVNWVGVRNTYGLDESETGSLTTEKNGIFAVFSHRVSALEPFQAYRARIGSVLSANSLAFNRTFAVPDKFHLIASQLNRGGNTVSDFIPFASEGSKIYKWNESTQQYVINTYEQHDDGTYGWTSPAMTLAPGEGVLFKSQSQPSVLKLIGNLPSGTLATSIPSGSSIRSSKLPQGGPLNSLGFPPSSGDTIFRWDVDSQAYIATSYSGGVWSGTFRAGDTSWPAVRIGEAFWIQTSNPRTWIRTFSFW